MDGSITGRVPPRRGAWVERVALFENLLVGHIDVFGEGVGHLHFLDG